MGVSLADEGKLQQLSSLVFTFGSNLWVGLIISSGPFDHSTTYSSLTLSAAGSTVPQATSGWTTPALTGDYHAKSTAGALTFLNDTGSDLTLYGWALYDPSSTTLWTIGDFSAYPFTLAAGLSVTITPFLRLTSE